MPFVLTTRTSFSLGAIIALFVLIAAFILWLVGGVTLLAVLVMVGALALALLLG